MALNSFLVKSNDPSGKIASLLIDPFNSFRYAAMPNCFVMTFITQRCSRSLLGPFQFALRFYDLPVA